MSTRVRRTAGPRRAPDGVPRPRGWGNGAIRWKSGAWEITVRPRRGAPQDPWTRLPGDSLAEAEAKLDLMVAQLNAGKHEPRSRQPAAMTVAELWERYAEHLAQRLAAGSIEQARVDDVHGIVRGHILPAFGSNPVTSVNSELLYGYMAAKRQGLAPVAGHAHATLAPRTIRHHMTVIGQMFRWAAHPERKLAAYDPTVGLQLPTIDEEETEPYELDHASAIIRLLPAGTVRRIGVFTMATGSRIAETLGAQEGGYKERRGKLEIRHALKRSGGKTQLAPRGKNKNAKRTLAVSGELAALLGEQLAHNATLEHRSGFLFPTEAGTAWNPSSFRNRHWYPAVYAAYAKVMTAAERDRWLAHMPAAMCAAAELLCLDDVSVRAVLDARYGDVQDQRLDYRDADGRPRSVQLSGDLSARLTASAGAERARIVPGRRGQPMALAAFIKTVFSEPFAAMGLRFDRRIHRCRHTFVSLVSLQPGITEKEIQHRVGHGHPSSTARYRHVFRAQHDKPADVLAQLTGQDGAARETKLEQAAALLDLDREQLAQLLAAAGS